MSVDEGSLFSGENPFRDHPGASRAISWERARFREHIARYQEEARAELTGILRDAEFAKGEVMLMLQSAGVLEADAPPATSWHRLVALVGYLAGKASVPPPPVHVVTSAKKGGSRARRS